MYVVRMGTIPATKLNLSTRGSSTLMCVCGGGGGGGGGGGIGGERGLRLTTLCERGKPIPALG